MIKQNKLILILGVLVFIVSIVFIKFPASGGVFSVDGESFLGQSVYAQDSGGDGGDGGDGGVVGTGDSDGNPGGNPFGGIDSVFGSAGSAGSAGSGVGIVSCNVFVGKICSVSNSCGVSSNGYVQCNSQCGLASPYPVSDNKTYWSFPAGHPGSNDSYPGAGYGYFLDTCDGAPTPYQCPAGANASCTDQWAGYSEWSRLVTCRSTYTKVLPPLLPPNNGNACVSAPNSCGAVGKGNYQCGGVCNATIPSVPNDLGSSCSAVNECGVNSSGTRQCNGSCSAVTANLPVGYGSYCRSTNNCGNYNESYINCSGTCPAIRPPDNVGCLNVVNLEIGTTKVVTDSTGSWVDIIPTSSQFVALGESCSIAWSASSATSCSIFGPGVDMKNQQPAGTFTTPKIGVNTTGSANYTITCYNGSVASAPRTFSCRLNPGFQEI